MIRARLGIPSLLVGFVLAALAPAPAAGDVSFEEVLPEGTLALMLVDDVAAFRDGLASTSWGRVLADPEMSAVRNGLSDGLADLAARGNENWGYDPLAMLDQVQGQVAFALLELSLPGDLVMDDPELAMAILMEVGDDVETFADAFDGLIERWVEDSGQLLKTETVRDTPAALVVDPDGKEGQMVYLFEDDVLVMVMANSETDAAEHAGRLVDGLRGEGEDAVLDAAAYATSVAARDVVEGPAVRIWLATGWFWELLQGFMEDDGEDGETALAFFEDGHVDALTSVATTSWFDEGWVHSVTRMDVSDDAGVWSVATAAIDDQRCRLLSLVPPGVATAFAADVDMGAMFDATLELLASIDPEVGLEVITSLSDAEADLGFHPKDDVVDGLDGQLAFFMSEVDPAEALPIPGGQPMNFCVAAGLYDGEETRRLIDGLVRRNGLHAARTRVEFEGYDLYLIPLGPGLSIAYAVLDDLFVVSASPSLVQDVLRRKANPELLSLATADFYREARGKLPEDETVVQYARAGDSIRSVITMLRDVQATGVLVLNPLEPPEVVPEEILEFLRTLALPLDDVVERHVSGAEVAVWVVEPGGSITARQVLP